MEDGHERSNRGHLVAGLGRRRTGEKLVDEARVQPAGAKGLVVEDLPEEAEIGANPAHLVFVQRADHACDGFVPGARPHHQLVQPAAVAADGLAQPLLDELVHEQAVDVRHLRGEPQQRALPGALYGAAGRDKQGATL